MNQGTTSGDISNDLSAAESLLTHSSVTLYQVAPRPANRFDGAENYSAVSYREIDVHLLSRTNFQVSRTKDFYEGKCRSFRNRQKSSAEHAPSLTTKGPCKYHDATASHIARHIGGVGREKRLHMQQWNRRPPR